jgi:hypothetical protein
MFHDTHKIADGFDVVDDQVANLQVGYLIFDSNQQFETIKVIAPEMAQVRIVDDTIKLDAELLGDDPTNVGGGIAIHVLLRVASNQFARNYSRGHAALKADDEHVYSVFFMARTNAIGCMCSS